MDLTPIAVGTDNQVNTTIEYEQLYPAITALSDGGFMVIWYNIQYGVLGQRYSADGSPFGSEFHVNTGFYDTGNLPSVASLSDGGFVVTWLSWQQDGDPSAVGVFARQFDAAGNAVTGDFCVNTYTGGLQTHSAVTGLADGGYVITWMSEGQDGAGFGIYGQRYTAEGATTGFEFQINTTTAGEQQIPEVAALADGGFIISWCGNGAGDDYGLFAQRFAADGSPAGDEFRINSTVEGNQLYQAITSLAGGGFVATWQSGDNGTYDVRGQRFDAQGNATGSEFLINTFTAGDQVSPQVTSTADGGFVVTWSSAGQDGSSYGVYGQRFSADGTPLGDEFRLNEITDGTQFSDGNSGGVSLATLQDGRIVQVWSGSGGAAPENVFFRMFDLPETNGAPVLASFVQTDPSTTNLGQVHYTLTFSEPVYGIELGNFSLQTTGLSGAMILSVDEVPGSDASVYVVTVSTGTGDGTIDLTFDGTGVLDAEGNALPGGDFIASGSYAGTDKVHAVAFADFSGDGNLDMASVNYGLAGPVSIRLGVGDGTFGTATNYNVGTQPMSIAVADLNGDAFLDLVVPNLTDYLALNGISLLLGNGDGTFRSGGTISEPWGSGPIRIDVGDIDNDGDVDLAIANYYASQASIFLGNGDGTFAAQVNYATGSNPHGIELADLNGDGNLDVVTANIQSDTISVLFGNGDGTLQTQVQYSVGDMPSSVAAGDVNNDGILDLVVANYMGNTVSLLLGDENGGFSPQVSLAMASNPMAVEVADLDEDGNLDILAINAGSDDIAVLFGNGDGTFDPAVRYPASDGVNSAAFADLNGDGNLDIGVTASPAQNVTIFLNETRPAIDGTYQIDRTAPEAPMITSVTDNVALYTGELANGASTNDTDLTVRVSLAGTGAIAGDTIRLYDGTGTGDPLGSTYTVTIEDISNDWIDIQTGALTDGSYSLTARITDAAGNESAVSTNSFSVVVDATAPAISSNGGGSTAALEVQENTTHVTNVLATDADPAEVIAFSISGGEDASLFQIVNGALSFVAAPDFEALPDDGATSGYQVTVQALDDAGNIDSQEITVTVTNVAGLTITASNRGQTLTGAGEEDLLQGGAGKDTLVGLGGNDTLRGGAGADILQGGAGHDWLDGGMSSDVLTGGGGEDTFAFTAALGKANVDSITDFVVMDDTIALAASVFKNIGEAGTALDSSMFCIGTVAQDATDRIIYNDATGALYYDGDGSGGRVALQFATLTAGLALTEHDFLII